MEQIRDFPMYSIDRTGTNIINAKTGKPAVIGDQLVDGKPTGYKYVTLCNEGYFWKRVAVHRLVAIAYIPNPNNLPEVNHKDRIRDNNNDWNLEWTTHQQNIQHSYDNGRKIYSGTEHWLTGNKASEGTKKLMSEAKLGENHPKFKGWYKKNGVKYPSSIIASKSTGEVDKTIWRQAKANKNGWSFVPKDNTILNQNIELEITNI